MVVDEGKQQQICAEHTNSKCVEPDSVVIADKSARIDLTDWITTNRDAQRHMRMRMTSFA